MRSIVIAVVSLAVVTAAGFLFIQYSDKAFHGMADFLEEQALPAVREEDWSRVRRALEELKEQWYGHEKVCAFFMDGETLTEIECGIARVEGLAEGEEKAALLSELYSLKRQLLSLYENELLTPGNMI
ncbi:MAG: DUF4363 family protein [Bacillota bacterium]|nr:DUF4363 family protein [Bacillota bacterium]